MNLPRSTIQELSTRYLLEPTVKDIFVEGPTDRRIFKWFVAARGFSDVQVYTIETVFVEVSEGGNRERLIQAAAQLEDISQGLERNVIFIADADSAHADKETHSERYLRLTDYACLESYFARKAYVERLADLFLGRPGVYNEQNLGNVLVICKKLFAVRVCAHSIGRCGIVYSQKDIGFEKQSGLRFEFEAVLRKTSQKNASLNYDDLKECVEERIEKWPYDAKFTMNGHDFIYLLSVVAAGKNVDRKFVDVDVLHGALMNCADVCDLNDFGLFQVISDIFGENSA